MRVLLAFICIALGGGAHAQSDAADALQKARAQGSLEFAVYDDFAPYSFKRTDGTPAGADVDLANALAGKLGLRARLRFIKADEQVDDDLRNHLWKGHYLGGGVADVMLHVPTDSAFAARQEQSLIFGNYFHESVAIGFAGDVDFAGGSPLALLDRKIAVELDTISDHYLSSAYGGRLHSAAVRKLSLREAVQALRANDVDAVMGPRGELQGLFALAGLPDMQYRQPLLNGAFNGAWDIGLAVRKRDGAPLRTALSHALEELRAQGALAAIFAAYRIEYVAGEATVASRNVPWQRR